MKDNITYGECLSEILKALNLKRSMLAREINIDSSLVYKWIRNERVPSYDSPYIDLILNYLSRRAINPPQRKALIEILAKYEIELFESSDDSLFNHLRLMLQNSQGYSIKLHNQMKSERKLVSTRISSVTGFIKNIDIQSSAKDNNSFDGEDFQSVINNGKLFCDSDNVKIARGNLKVLYAAISLLKQAPITPLSDNNTILITFNSYLKLLLTKNDLYCFWIKRLHELLSGGWKLIVHITLDNNADRTISIIEVIQSLLPLGNLTVYYCNKYSNDLPKN
ncbi:MAG: XRE family transcriptional regulator, partial [Eubacteriales bacterium]|nr:XRE family transcriptional regulator [Eubacteriales bacterium]